MAATTVIRGGEVVDGSGAPARRADVAVENGRIAAIGTGLDGDEVLDASGCVVSPGFIDIHTHYDAQVCWDPALTPSSWHGVTSVIAGNCGFSIAPARSEHHQLLAETLSQVEDMSLAALTAGIRWDFSTFPEYLGQVRRQGTTINFGAYIGHTALRLFVLGDEGYERRATPAELAQMRRLVREGIEAGAAGFSSSVAESHVGGNGLPVPSRVAGLDELEALALAAGETRRGVVMLNIGSWRQVTIDWLGRLQRAMGVPVTWVPLITTPDGRHDVQLAESRAIRLDGAQVWPQVSPLPIVQDVSLARPAIFNTNPVVAALITQPVEARRAAYADPRWRADAAASFPTQAPAAPRWDTYRIARSRAHPELEGLAVSRLAEERRSSVFEVLLDLALDEEDLGLRILATTANDDEEGVTRLLQGTTCTLGLSDAGAHLGQHCEADQATVFLGHWVRERRVMDLPTAVRRLTGLQADLFGIAGRGYLRPGYHADVVVFDPLEVGSGPHTRADDFPAGASRILAAQPRGLRFVLVNGTTTVVDSRPRTAGVRPGALLEFAPR